MTRPSFSNLFKGKKLNKAQRKKINDAKRKKSSAQSNDGGSGSGRSKPPSKKQCTTLKTNRQLSKDNDEPIVSDDDGSLALAADLLLNLPKNIWYRLLQDPDSEMDIKHGTRQDWALIIPVFLKAQLYSPPPTDSGTKKLQFNKNRWDDLKKLIDHRDNITIEHVPIRFGKENISHHILIRNNKSVKYRNPVIQKAEVIKQGVEEALGVSSTVGKRRNTRQNNVDDNAMTARLEKFRSKFEEEFIAFTMKEMEKETDIMYAIKQYQKELNASVEKHKSQKVAPPVVEEEGNDDNNNDTDNVYRVQGRGGGTRSILGDAVEQQINAALSLDLNIRPRQRREGEGNIDVHKRKQTKESERVLAVHVAKMWGHDNLALTYHQRRRIEDAACKLIAYDHGFGKSTGGSMINKWAQQLSSGVLKSGNTAPLKSNHKGRKSTTTIIEEENEGYLHELYRYAISVIGAKATFKDITDIMNERSQSPAESRPELNLHFKQVYKWWKDNGGEEKSAFEKPRLTEEHKRQRAEWVVQWKKFLDEDFPVCYLDEKWFYTQTRRRKLKLLPRAKHESPGVEFVKRPKTRSRRFPIKIMYMGVVGRPRTVGERHFDGRIMLERISKTETVKKRTKHQRFTNDAIANYELKNGKWKDLYVADSNMTVGEFCEVIAETYDLDGDVADRLELHYEDWTQGQKKTKKIKPLKDNEQVLGHKAKNEDGTVVDVQLDDLCLGVRYKVGDKVQHDVNCDSDYMLSIMPKVGKAIREAYFWVDKDDPVYCVLDSAGGHGKKDVVFSTLRCCGRSGR